MMDTNHVPGTNELFRMEKSVMTRQNFDELSGISNDNIPEALLEYICYEHQYNIFGYGLLDPVEFARKFRFSHNYLMSRHPTPYHSIVRKSIKDGGRSINRRCRIPEAAGLHWDSRLENALFILGNFSMNITGTAVLNERTLVRRQEFLRVLESFSVIQDMRTGKLLYAYKLDDRFRRNLSSLYLTISCESIVSLRKSRLQPLYTFLVTLRDALFSEGRTSTEVGNTPDFDFLCYLAGIQDCTQAKYRKRDLNRGIRHILECTELDFTLEWVKGNARERYTPIFHFNVPPGLIIGNQYDRAIQVHRSIERVGIAVHEFLHNLVEVCPFEGNRYSPSAEDFFFEWITSDDAEQVRLMEYALEKTFINLGCGIPPDISRRISLFRHSAGRFGRRDIDTWLREIFSSSQYGFSLPVFKCSDERRAVPLK